MHVEMWKIESTGRIFAGLIAAEGFCIVVGIKSGNIWGLLLTVRGSCSILSGYVLRNVHLWKTVRHAFCCVEIRKLGCLVLAVLILQRQEFTESSVLQIMEPQTVIFMWKVSRRFVDYWSSAGVDQVDYRAAIVNPL